jgi:UDP-GlcNAc:undecaprenyl-phosphate GlcNAc-1-phosphate transferase
LVILALVVSFVSGLLLVPVTRSISIRIGKVSPPRPDRWHSKPTPLLGGVAIYASFIAAIALYAWVTRTWSEFPWGLLLGSSMMFVLGLYDDFKPLTPPAKLVGQIVAVMIVIYQGYTTSFFTPRLGDSLVAQLPNILLTSLWLVGITNAINLLDNMDGLAGGIAFIAAGFMSVLFWQAGSLHLLVVSLGLAGATLAFLVFNFPPAKIFMGDSGSMLLGFTLAVLAIARQPQASNLFAIMGVPTLLLLLPIMDTTLVTLTRLMRGQSPALGGRDHTSHRLIAFGLTERQAVLTLYTIALVSGLAALAVENLDYALSLFIIPVLILALSLATAYLGRMKVVTPSDGAHPSGAIARLMIELTYRRRLLEIMFDFVLIGVVYYVSFLVYSRFTMPAEMLELYLGSLPIAYTGAYLSFIMTGVYRGLWRYVGVDDLLRYIRATVGVVALETPIVIFTYRQQFPLEVMLLFGVFLFLGLAASRSSFRILDRAYGQATTGEQQRVLIYGAGDSGEIAARWLMMNPELGLRAVGYLDDDPLKAGRLIHGIPVYGGVDQIDDIIRRRRIDGVLLTADGKNKNELVLACAKHDCWIKTVRLEIVNLE